MKILVNCLAFSLLLVSVVGEDFLKLTKLFDQSEYKVETVCMNDLIDLQRENSPIFESINLIILEN